MISWRKIVSHNRQDCGSLREFGNVETIDKTSCGEAQPGPGRIAVTRGYRLTATESQSRPKLKRPTTMDLPTQDTLHPGELQFRFRTLLSF